MSNIKNAIEAEIDAYAKLLLEKLETKAGQITESEARSLFKTFYLDIMDILKSE
jgi:hypothetical protein